MKKIILIVFGLFMVVSCNKVKSVKEKISEVKTQAEEVTATVKNAKTLAEQSGTIEEDITRLSELEPISNEKLKNWLPTAVGDFNRSSFKIGELKMAGISSIEAGFSNEEQTQNFTLQVVDGAGGGVMYLTGLKMGFQMDMEEESERDFRRTVEKNGHKAMEEARKDGSSSKIQFIQNDRFFIEIKGEQMDLDALWKIVEQLKLDQLP